ncbi:hypothetical protein CDL12_09912 [Handroanthus impetiginosus]|uniref:Uncharacterized protein n=1 Tax=Handroanthus impetiginosus TaxID=429701 RepID=A0A2G9HIS5_9LAMI|nr:hypothetical protein CDL12_09912 [Handroanthus impetiginosus]
MEKLLNHYDREYMKMAMLKHEETFREQVYELHRLYEIQKMLMKEIAKKARSDPRYCNKLEAKQCFDLERPAEELNCPEVEDEQSELELTLGSRSYYKRKIKASEPAFPADSGLSFSSSSTGSSQGKGRRSGDMLSLSNQDRLKSPPWLFQALSLNMT